MGEPVPAAWVFEDTKRPIISTLLLLLSRPLPRGNVERFLSNNLLLLKIFSRGFGKAGQPETAGGGGLAPQVQLWTPHFKKN